MIRSGKLLINFLRSVHTSDGPLIDLTDGVSLPQPRLPGGSIRLDVGDEEEETLVRCEAVADVHPPH